MSKRKKKKEELDWGGFEEVLDLIGKGEIVPKKFKTMKIKNEEKLDLYNHLINETARLQNLHYTLSLKIKTYTGHPQMNTLIPNQINKLKDAKENLLKKVSVPSSHMHENLALIFDRAISFDLN